MAAQVATEARRHLSEVEADQQALREAQAGLATVLFAQAAGTWPEAAEKATFLPRRFAATAAARDPRCRQMIAAVLEDLRQLAARK